MTTQTMTKTQAMVVGARLPTLLASLSPVVIGHILGMRAIGWDQLNHVNYAVFGMTAAAAMLMQAGANYVNDLCDGIKGVDTASRLGPPRLSSWKTISQSFVRNCYLACFLLALVLSSALAYHGGVEIFVLGLVCVAFAYLYTGGPYPLSYLGLGEVTAFLFFGPVAVLGSYYLQTKSWGGLALLAGIGPGLLAGAMMAINNYRDIDTDLVSRKRTLAVRLGRKVARWIPVACLILAPTVLVAYSFLSGNVLISTALALAMIAFVCTRIVPLLNLKGHELNRALKRTAAFNLLYGVVFSLVVLL